MGGEKIEEISRNYGKIFSFTASFEQISYDAFQDRAVASSGKLFFKKPGLMRWEYVNPEKQSVFIDRRKVTLYDPYLENVTLQKIEDVELVESLFFFRNSRPIGEAFSEIERPSVFLFDETVSGDSVVYLVPQKKTPYVKELHLNVSDKGEILNLAVLEENGNYRNFAFKDYFLNSEFKDDFFQFQIPEGMEVIDNAN